MEDGTASAVGSHWQAHSTLDDATNRPTSKSSPAQQPPESLANLSPRDIPARLQWLLKLNPGFDARYQAAREVIRVFRRASFYEVSQRCNLFCEGCYYFESDSYKPSGILNLTYPALGAYDDQIVASPLEAYRRCAATDTTSEVANDGMYCSRMQHGA